jgi:hypothetical protein
VPPGDDADIIESGPAASALFRRRLADWARRQPRSRSIVAGLTAAALAAVATLAAYLATAGPGPRPAAHRPFPIAVDGGQGVQALAAAGPYLYLATDYGGSPPYALAAYDRTTGQRIRQLAVPAMPVALRAGPGGNVWLTFSPDQGSGPAGTVPSQPAVLAATSTTVYVSFATDVVAVTTGVVAYRVPAGC